MALEKYLSTQGAIVVAGALIAAGLFFGLRGRPPEPVAAIDALTALTALSPPGASASPSSAIAAAPPPGPPAAAPPAVLDRASVAAAAASSLERNRAAAVTRCVQPALAKKPEPAQVKLLFNVTFDARGKQIGRGVSEDRATSRPDVTQCVTDLLLPLEIPAPGMVVQTDVPWVLP